MGLIIMIYKITKLKKINLNFSKKSMEFINNK